MESLLWWTILSAVPCHPSHFASGPSRVCRRTHFALFRWAITQNSLCVPPGRGLKISPQKCVNLSVLSAGPPGMCICFGASIHLWRWQRDKCLRSVCEWICAVGFSSSAVLDSSNPLLPMAWWTQRQLCVKKCSESLALINKITWTRSALSK